MHLTDEQLNEYLDHETIDRALIETHLSSCVDCAARLSALQALFTEIESLPELEWIPPIAARVSPSPGMVRSLTLTMSLQAVLTVIAIVIAAPFITRFVSPLLGAWQMPSLTVLFSRTQASWIAWLDTLPNLRWPVMPQVPVLDVSSLSVMIALASMSLLWLVGNGLLLRDRTK